MKKTLLFSRLIAIGLMMLFSSGWAVGQTVLTAGDIAVLRMNTDAPDAFSFVNLVELASGTEIRFTDSGVKSDGSFRTGEGAVKYTAPSIIAAGTIIHCDVSNLSSLPANFTRDDDATVGTNGMNLSSSGDQIIAFQGLSVSPTYLFALNGEGAGVWQADATSSNTSALPTGLTNGTNAIAVTEADNIVYDMLVTSGTKADLLNTICNSGNWDTDNTTPKAEPAGSFTVTVSGTPTLTITSPNGGESWVEGSAYDITWTSSDYTGTVDIEYTTDDVNYSLIIEDTDNDGVHSWGTEYDIAADTYKIRISDDRTSITTSDESDAVFELTRTIYIDGSMTGWGAPVAMTLQEDLGTSSWKYTYQENAVTAIAFKYKTDGSGVWTYQWSGNGTVTLNNHTAWLNDSGNGEFTATLGKFYTYIFNNAVANGGNGEGYVFETTATPVTLDAVSQLPTEVTPSNPVVVTITASATPSAEENVYVRYTTDGFTSSSYVLASFTGTAGTATIPAQADGTTVTYYVLSTGLDLTTPPTDVDLATIHYNTNSGANYSYYSETPGVEPIIGDLVITEVAGEDADGNGDDDGYVEIYNTSSNRLTLDNVIVRYFNLNPNDAFNTVTLSGVLDAGEFIVVTRDDAAFLAQYGFSADFSGSDFYFNGGDDGIDIYHSSLGTLDQFNDNGASASAWTWTDYSVYERTNSGSGAVQSNWTEYPDETGSPKELLAVYWRGTVTTDWNTTGNWLWGIIPDATYNVSIFSGLSNYPYTPASLLVSANSLEIAAGASLEVSGAGNLQASGDVAIHSDASSSGSLIGNIQDGSGIDKVITYNRYVTGGQWHLVGASFEGQDIGDLIDDASSDISVMKDYNTGTDSWNADFTSATAGTMTSGEGYAVKRSTDGVISISGTIPSNPNVTLDKTGNGWNLLGNPYASAVYATDPGGFGLDYLLNATNVGHMASGFEALYVWEENVSDPTNTNNYKLVNNAGSGDLNKVSPQVTHLQAGQGFFVKASAIATTFNYSVSMQDHQSTLSLYKEESVQWPTVTINAEISNAKASTTIAYNSMMTKGLDKTYDAGLLNSYPEFALYSRLVEDYEGIDFMLQALPEDYDNLIIPIGLDAKAGEIVTFSARTLNIPEGYVVVLEDRAMNTFTNLSDGGESAVQLTNDSDGTGRFFVRTSIESTLGLGDLDTEKAFQVFTRVNDYQLVIRGEAMANTVARIYSITGKQIATVNLEQATEQSVPFNEESGVYIVQITNDHGTYTQKFSWVK